MDDCSVLIRGNHTLLFLRHTDLYSKQGSSLILNLRTAARTTKGTLSFSAATNHVSELRVAHIDTLGTAATDYELDTYSYE